jgi:WD40 repeat protein
MNSQRPFRAATASDDGGIVFYHGERISSLKARLTFNTINLLGAPYKPEKTIRKHSQFVQDVRFAPSGDLFASVGSDARIFLYDGKTGDMNADLGGSIHKGTIVRQTCSFLLVVALINLPSLRSHGAPIVTTLQPPLQTAP